MSIKRSIFFFIILVFATSIYASDQLHVITVTASRTPVPIDQVAGAITVITKAEIERQNAVYVSDLLQSVPGVNVSRLGSAGNLTQVRVRGAEANQVLVIVDGVEVNDPAAGSEFNFAHLSAADIERIEVLRGPQSSLWGSDALAGVINITTTKSLEQNNFIATSSYGTEHSYQGGLQYFAETEAMKFALSGNFIDTHGFNIATTGQERDGYDNATLNLNSELQANQQLIVGASARYTNASNEFDPAPRGVPVDGFGRTDTEQVYGRAYIKAFTFKDRWQHLLEASITDTSNDSIDALFGAAKTEATKEKFSYQSTVLLPRFGQSNYNQSLTLALEREQERFHQQGASLPGFDPNQRQKITNYGTVAEYRANILDRWTLSASMRHDDNDEFENNNTYRVGINYLWPSTDTKLYLTHATGVKNPTFTELFGFAPNNFIGNPDLEPETSESWEVGISQQFFDSRLKIDAAIFAEDLSDEIQTIFLPTFQSTVVNNESRSERNGVELSIFSELSDSLTWGSTYTYLDATEPDELDNDRTEIRRPSNQWSGYLNYLFPGARANLNVSIHHIGDRRDIDFSSGDRITLDEYTRVDISFNYQIHGTLEFYARLNNVLDEEYQDVFGFEAEEFSAFAGLKVQL